MLGDSIDKTRVYSSEEHSPDILAEASDLVHDGGAMDTGDEAGRNKWRMAVATAEY
jgi:hypothetical protein